MPERITQNIDYDEQQGVGIWIIDDLKDTLESGELADAEEHFREHAGQPSMSACVIEIENTESVGSETLSHVNEQWTELGEATNMKRTAYVADGIARLAIANKNDAEGMDARGFEERDAAVEWTADV